MYNNLIQDLNIQDSSVLKLYTHFISILIKIKLMELRVLSKIPQK